MKITDVRVKRINKSGNLKAVVSVTFEEIFVVHDVKVIEGEKGLFIAMPSRKSADGIYRDVAHPLNTEIRTYFNDTILKKYNEIIATEE